MTKKLEIQLIYRKETKDFLADYFEKRDIIIEDVNFDVKFVMITEYIKIFIQ